MGEVFGLAWVDFGVVGGCERVAFWGPGRGDTLRFGQGEFFGLGIRVSPGLGGLLWLWLGGLLRLWLERALRGLIFSGAYDLPGFVAPCFDGCGVWTADFGDDSD